MKTISSQYVYSCVRSLCVLALLPGYVWAQRAADPFELSLAELLDVEIQVSAISRRLQNISESSAAIYVLTAEDIQNSSALNIPDLLRVVPGIEVAQIDANKWAVSARGFNSRLAGKLLLVIDGRTIYSSSYAAVFWEGEDIPLQNIERIEVIRGPGATIWGANAINGVVSITTKAAATTGGSLNLVGGNSYEQKAYVQHTASIGDRASLKVFANFSAIADSPGLLMQSADDDWRSGRIGFRLDSALTGTNSLLVTGESSHRHINQKREIMVSPGKVDYGVLTPAAQSSGHLLARWVHKNSAQQSFTTQFYYDRKDVSEMILQEQVDTYDVDFYYNDSRTSHNLIVGGGIRQVNLDSLATPVLVFTPQNETQEIYNAYVYDDVTLSDKSVLGFGLKVEKNVYTGVEYQANVRFNHELSDTSNAWAAVSRAVRTPSRAERSSRIVIHRIPRGTTPGTFLDTYLVTQASPEFDVEELKSLELGWRTREPDLMNLDITAFYNEYSGLRNVALGQPYCQPEPVCSFSSDYVLQPLTLINSDSAESWGYEILVQRQISRRLSVEASYSNFAIDYDSSGFVHNDSSLTAFRDEPLTKFILQGNWQLNNEMRLDLSYRHVSDAGVADIASYDALDARFRWTLNPGLDLSILARNVGADAHLEFFDSLVPTARARVESSYHLEVNYSW